MYCYDFTVLLTTKRFLPQEARNNNYFSRVAEWRTWQDADVLLTPVWEWQWCCISFCFCPFYLLYDTINSNIGYRVNTHGTSTEPDCYIGWPLIVTTGTVWDIGLSLTILASSLSCVPSQFLLRRFLTSTRIQLQLWLLRGTSGTAASLQDWDIAASISSEENSILTLIFQSLKNVNGSAKTSRTVSVANDSSIGTLFCILFPIN